MKWMICFEMNEMNVHESPWNEMRMGGEGKCRNEMMMMMNDDEWWWMTLNEMLLKRMLLNAVEWKTDDDYDDEANDGGADGDDEWNECDVTC